MSFASLFFFVRKKTIVLLGKVNLFTVVVAKHVWPYFQSRFPKPSSEHVSSWQKKPYFAEQMAEQTDSRTK
jgi:hypothetical protein